MDGREYVDALEELHLLEGRGRRVGPHDLCTEGKLYADRVLSDTLPIGEYDGDLFLIGTTGENVGKVFFWSHEDESETPSYDNVTLAADTFGEFVDGLRVEEAK